VKPKELKKQVEMLNEVNRDYAEMGAILHDSLKGVARETRSLNKLWRSKSRSKLVKIGMALILFPDPTISDVVGTAMVAAGVVHDRIKNSGLYLEDVYKTYPRLLKDLYLEK